MAEYSQIIRVCCKVKSRCPCNLAARLVSLTSGMWSEIGVPRAARSSVEEGACNFKFELHNNCLIDFSMAIE